MTLINQTFCKIVTVSFLKEKQRAIVSNAWESRFHSDDNIWIDASEDDSTADIAKKIVGKFRGQGVLALAGVKIIVTILLDMTEDVNSELVKNVLQVSRLLCGDFGCVIPLTFEFGYLGQIAFGNRNRFKDNIKKVIAVNVKTNGVRMQLCLVADNPLARPEEEHNWKAVSLLIDFLRRSATPATLVPIAGADIPNDDVGFIRYAEFDTVKREQLTKRETQLVNALGNGGQERFENLIALRQHEISEYVSENYRAEWRLIPVHPDLYISGMKCYNRRTMLAKRENARIATVNALEQTGRALEKKICAMCGKSAQQYEEMLEALVKEAELGLVVESDAKQMLPLFEYGEGPRPYLPGLEYNRMLEPNLMPAEEYLRNVTKYAEKKAIMRMMSGLKEAYEKHDETYYAGKRIDLQKELGSVRTALSQTMSQDNFIQMITGNRPLPETCFHPMIGGGSQLSAVICRNSETAQRIDNSYGGVYPHNYLVDERYGGLITIDNAPIKAFQLLLFNCDDVRLNDLLGID